MPLIKNITPVSYSSQDPKHTIYGLLKGSSSWLSASEDKSGKITADLQLDRATAISYVDVGNFNSVTLSLEVRRSCGGPELPLLPTVVLMTPQQLRTGHASTKAVRMFKTEDLSQDAVSQKWDRIRLTCSQPFRKDLQFGLAFLRFYTTDAAPDPPSLPLASTRYPGGSSSNASAAATNVGLGDFTLEIGSEMGSSIVNSSSTNNGIHKGYINKSNAVSDEDILSRLNRKGNQSTRKSNVQTPAIKRFDRNSVNLSTSFNKRQSSGAGEESVPSPTAHNDTTDSAATNRQQFLARLNMNAKKSKTLPTSIQSLEAQRVHSGSGGEGSGSAPLSRTAQLVAAAPASGRPPTARAESALEAAHKQQTQFEYEGLEFLIALNLQLDELYRLKVSDVRRQLESQRGSPLTPGERVVFRDLALDYCARRIQTLEQDSMKRFANGPQNKSVIDVDSPETDATAQRGQGTTRSNGNAAAKRRTGQSIDLRGLNTSNDETVTVSSNAETAGHREKSATKKYTFKRLPDSGSSSPLVTCSSGTGNSSAAPSAKKAKFREDNPLNSISATGVNRNRLAMCDSNAADFDNPVWNKTPNSSKKRSQALESQASTPKNKENKRRPRTPKTPTNASTSTTVNTVGVWLSSTNKSSPASRSGTVEKPRPYSFSNSDLEIEDPFSDDDVDTVHELDRLMDERSHQPRSQASPANTAKRKGTSTPGKSALQHAPTIAPNASSTSSSLVAGSPVAPATDRDGWLRIKRTLNTPGRTPTTLNSGRPAGSRRGGIRSNRGSSTVVVMDSDDDGSSNATNSVSRTALTPSVVIGSLRGGSNDTNMEQSPNHGGGNTGFKLGAVPQNKFSLQSSRPCDTQLIDDSDSGGDEDDQVECPICSGSFAPSAIECHAASCSPHHIRSAAESAEEETAHELQEQQCPVCQELLQASLFEAHVQVCAERNFS